MRRPPPSPLLSLSLSLLSLPYVRGVLGAGAVASRTRPALHPQARSPPTSRSRGEADGRPTAQLFYVSRSLLSLSLSLSPLSPSILSVPGASDVAAPAPTAHLARQLQARPEAGQRATGAERESIRAQRGVGGRRGGGRRGGAARGRTRGRSEAAMSPAPSLSPSYSRSLGKASIPAALTATAATSAGATGSSATATASSRGTAAARPARHGALRMQLEPNDGLALSLIHI